MILPTGLGAAHHPFGRLPWRRGPLLLEQALADRGEPAYRVAQVWEWAARGASGYEEMMTNLPAALPERARGLCAVLDAHARDGGALAGRHREGALPDGRRSSGRDRAHALPRRTPIAVPVVPVRLPAHLLVLRDRRDALRQEPDVVEVLDQALHFRRHEPVDHAVFMGMGEPMLNLDPVLAAARWLPALGITHRRTTISTVGWLPGLRRFVDEVDEPIRLALSLHARARSVPS